MKHVQKMLMVPEHLLQTMETEHRLTAPAQLTTLTRLDENMKQIMNSSLAEDQKVLLLDHALQRYRGLVKQMKSEVSVKTYSGSTQIRPSASNRDNARCKQACLHT